MNIAALGKSIGLAKQLIDPTVVTRPITETKPQKPFFDISVNKEPLFSCEECGISSDIMINYLRELCTNGDINLQNLLIYRNGRLILELGVKCWRTDVPKNTFSQCKSITGLAIGILIDEGVLTLDTPMTEIFGKSITPIMRFKFKDVTVRHLLTMSSGVLFNEVECMTTDNWLKGCFNSGKFAESGKKFAYNSLNSYILSAAVKELTGQSLSAYLDEKLFGELEITNYFWEKCPNGTEKGGWGLYILPCDMAKLGQLVLDNGRYNGKQLISEEYIKEATKTQINVAPGMGNYDYGYYIWTGRGCNCFLFNGMLGQNMLGYRDNGILVVSNAGNGDAFQQNAFFEITDRYFAKTFPESLPANKRARKRLDKAVKELSTFKHRRNHHLYERIFRKRTIARYSQQICGSYRVVSKEGSSSGIMPLMMQVVQNNYTKGMQYYRFEYTDKALYLICTEKDCETRLKIGFDAPSTERLEIMGEKCLVATTAEFRHNEDDLTVLKLRIDFLEFPYTKTMKFIFDGDMVKIRQGELPGRSLVDKFDITETKLPDWVTNMAAAGVENIQSKLAAAFEVTVRAKKE